ncbi:TLC domain-containing protein 4-B [Aplysia californica]|uniref:TLC domain-containing protein 4-B n=1 Tax=Aplysia californica TaxID=6500 RepID=A0ABM0JKM4_APLCA|nr:TLC domain-containing protein 4-B [Aplysia californica]
MGRRLELLYFDTTYYPVAAFSCAFFLYLYKYASPKLSSKFCAKYSLLSEQEQVEWNNRVGSTVHSVVISFVCAYTMLYDDEIAEEPIWWDSPVVRTSCAVVAGYMTSDVIVMSIHYKQIGDVFYVLHHGASIYAYYYVMTYGVLPYFANYRLVAEFSTPFVNQRWFLTQLGYERTSQVFVTNGVAMAVTFFSARIATMPSYWHRVFRVYNTPAFNRLGYIQLCLIIPCLVLDVLNIYWFYKICAGAYKICSMFYVRDKDVNVTNDKKLLPSTLDGTFYNKQTLIPSHPASRKHID